MYQVPYCPPPVPVAQWECHYHCYCAYNEGEDLEYIVGIGRGGTQEQAKSIAKAAANAECAALGGTCLHTSFFDCFDPIEFVPEPVQREGMEHFRYRLTCADNSSVLIVAPAIDEATARRLVQRNRGRIASARSCHVRQTDPLGPRSDSDAAVER